MFGWTWSEALPRVKVSRSPSSFAEAADPSAGASAADDFADDFDDDYGTSGADYGTSDGSGATASAREDRYGNGVGHAEDLQVGDIDPETGLEVVEASGEDAWQLTGR